MFPDPFDTAWWLIQVAFALVFYGLILLLLAIVIDLIFEAIATTAKKAWKGLRS